MRYYIDSNKRPSKREAIKVALISLAIVFVLSALIFFFVDKMIGLSMIGFFLIVFVFSLMCLLVGNNNLPMPYAEIIGEDIVFFNQKSKEKKRIPLSTIKTAEITTGYRYKLYTTPSHVKYRYTIALAWMVFGPKYIVFYDTEHNFLFGLYLCKENYEAFKKYLPQPQQDINIP